MENAVAEISQPVHRSVLSEEVVSYLVTRPEGVYVDATLGMGGHTKSILDHTHSRSLVIGLDVDEESISISRERLSAYNGHVIYRNSNFSDIDKVLDGLDIREVDGILADLGMSSYQIETSERGFSFMREEPLDMRMDPRLRFTAYDLVNEMTMDEISRVLRMYGEEKWSKRIAKRIVETRKENPIRTSAELARVVSEAIPRKFHPARIHPATKTFQALRIAVNNELENIKEFIGKAVSRLRIGGRLVIISFHSLEDRLVKSSFLRMSSPCVCPPGMPECGCGKKRILKIITRTPIVPGEEEILNNPRARSAKMRVGERV
ncbi:MAG: 16S rRNA (cytosine(1402)-N(4))-methyltransferase RsmH [Thermodesulfobacteriota bacterium]